MMPFWKNLPLFLILVPLICAALCSVLRGRAAKALMLGLVGAVCACSVAFLCRLIADGESYVYKMGEIGAPFGNELRAGVLEGVMGLLFSAVMLLSLMGGWRKLKEDIDDSRTHLYCVMICLLMAALMALTYTNDLFTAYVFIEITTIAACALISITNLGRTLFAATRYMIMNLLGSGLFLLGLAILYCLTGQLLFPQLLPAVKALIAGGKYGVPLYLSILLMAVGIGVKSALYPFHTWLPNAYASATPASSAILSSLISKAYIFLLIKIVFRGVGAEALTKSGVGDVLFVFSLIGILLGSVDAIREHNIKRMIAWSSVSQIGYIFLGVSVGTPAGACAAAFHICAHSVAKAMLFLCVDRLVKVSGGSPLYRDLRGSGYRAPLAGVAFSIGAFSIVGIPPLAGFASKTFLSASAMSLSTGRMLTMLFVIAVSTLLNLAYFMRTVLTLYRRGERFSLRPDAGGRQGAFGLAMGLFIGLNLLLGVYGGQVMEWIDYGMRHFA